MQLVKEISATDRPARTNLIEFPNQHEHENTNLGPEAFLYAQDKRRGLKMIEQIPLMLSRRSLLQFFSKPARA